LNEAILWATFAGAWLLVAGPLYQGSVELGELDFDRDGIQGTAAAVHWWWLLPPVMYMTPEQVRHAKALLTQPDATVASIARLLNVSRSTLTSTSRQATPHNRSSAS
jgi:hypothetical protein